MIVVAALLFTSIGIGFLLTLDRFAPPLPTIARLLPVTYEVELLHDVMLRGHGVDQTGFRR